MKTFEKAKFKWTFRSYQQNVLDNAQKHLKDGRIHIVAAPGSGKTILGLELIRRLSAPALVLSPSVTIRQQWGERFGESYLPETENAEEYLSYDLKEPSLITSVTYQALHAAFTKTELKGEKPEDTDDETDEEQTETTESFDGFDLVAEMKKAGVRTVCLDEAHHLRSEWQRALEGFLKDMGEGVTLIALTATPPYDSTPAEWERYSSLCGEIDEEIFVPQLVAQKTLCPHQDYVYFNYPTAEELAAAADYRKNASETVRKILKDGTFTDAVKASGITTDGQKSEETILENDRAFLNVITVAKSCGMFISDKAVRLVAPKGKLPQMNDRITEAAFQFVIDNPEIFTEEASARLKTALSGAGLIEKRKVCLSSNDKITKMLIASNGKLGSINDIVNAESKSLGGSLRMLILTDYIKRDMLKIVGTGEPVAAMGTVPVFESVRRNCGSTPLAVLSGGLVIVPNATADKICAIAESKGIKSSLKPLGETGYSEAVFSGSNKNKVAILTEAFGRGLFNVLIGTKSLLGEGWDSPCINSLILASFVGSFMLSNQMRGRAIRMDKNAPDKASNIWHIVTVNPDENKDGGELVSSDFDMVKRRFACFLAPAYSTDVIKSGIDRVDIIKPPYNSTANISEINRKMLTLAADREGMAKKWSGVVQNGERTEILDVAEIPQEAKPKSYKVRNMFVAIALVALAAVILAVTLPTMLSGDITTPTKLLLIALYAAVGIYSAKAIAKAIRSMSPLAGVKPVVSALLSAMKKTGAIDSDGARLNLAARGENVTCSIDNATEHDKKVFSNAVSELFSAIDNPRYVLVRKLGEKGHNYADSYACPSVIGAKKESAAVLAESLRKSGKYDVIYTRSEDGHKALLQCRKHCRLNENGCRTTSGKQVG